MCRYIIIIHENLYLNSSFGYYMKKNKFFSSLGRYFITLYLKAYTLASLCLKNRILITLVVYLVCIVLYNLCLTDILYCDTPSPEPSSGADASSTDPTSSDTTAAPQNLEDYAVRMLDTVERIKEGTYTQQDENFVRSQFDQNDPQDQFEVTMTLAYPQRDAYQILEHLERGAQEILEDN